MLLQEGRGAAAGRSAFTLAFWTLIESAEPPQISVRTTLQNEDVELVIGDTEACLLEHVPQRLVLDASQGVEAIQAAQPKRQVDVLAFVPECDSGAPVGREARNLLVWLARQRADQRNPAHVGMTAPCCGDGVRGVTDSR